MKKKLVNSTHLKNNVYIAYRCKVTILNLTECKIQQDPITLTTAFEAEVLVSTNRRHQQQQQQQQRLPSQPGNSLRYKAAKQQTSTRDVSGPKHNQNYTGLHNYTDGANYTDKSKECLGVVVVRCKASWLWDFGLPGRLIQRSLPSAHLKAPSTGNQALHCCQCCTGSVISW